MAEKARKSPRSREPRPLRPFARSLLSTAVKVGRTLVPERPENPERPEARQEPAKDLARRAGGPTRSVEVPGDSRVSLEREATRRTLAEAGNGDEGEQTAPDVLLDIPTIKVDEIRLDVENLDARVALHAQLANLVRIDVGANVGIAKVELDIKGVEAQALLKVRLKRVYEILARALDTVDNNPEILRSLLEPVGKAVGTLGAETGRAVGELGTQAGRALGPGGALDETLRDVGGTAKEALGPGGAVSGAVKDVGETAKGVAAPEGPLGQAVQGVSHGVGDSVQGLTRESEQERRRYEEKGRTSEHEPPPAGIKKLR